MKKALKVLLLICISFILLAMVLFIIFSIYTKVSVKCEAYQIWLNDFNEDILKTVSSSKKYYGVSDNQLNDMYSHPENYIYAIIDYSAKNNTDITFYGLEAEGEYRNDFVLGSGFHTILLDNTQLILYGKSHYSELGFTFIVKKDGKTKEEILSIIKNSKIYITGSAFIINCRWKLDLSYLQKYTSIEQVKNGDIVPDDV